MFRASLTALFAEDLHRLTLTLIQGLAELLRESQASVRAETKGTNINVRYILNRISYRPRDGLQD